MHRRQLLYTGLGIALPLAAAAEDPVNAWFIFLNKGTSKKPLAPEDAKRMQAEHMANIQRLGKLGKTRIVGPLGDNGFTRGIMVLEVSTRAEVTESFREDPFVKHDYLSLDIYRCRVSAQSIGKPSETEIGQHAIAFVKRSGSSPAPGDAKTFADLGAMLPELGPRRNSGDIPIVLEFSGNGPFLGALLFRAPGAAAVQSWAAELAAVKRGLITVEAHPQYLAAGLISPRDVSQ